MRRLLLWCAQNRWLAAHVPRWGFARRAVRRFMPGEDFGSALRAAIEFRAMGIGSVFTLLGENVTDLGQASTEVEHYERLLIEGAELDAEISVKPTHLGLDVDPEAAYANLLRLAKASAKAKSFLWIDMEGSAYTERTIDLYNRVHAHHPLTGICLQAYLHRTAADVASLLPHKPAIRLVKGAYSEPPEIAFQAKRDVDANYLALSAFAMPAIKRRDVRLVLATHDVDLIDRVWRFGSALGLDRSEIEVNMLYGIRTDQQLRLKRDGYVVKGLIAYGEAWYAWYLRRLAERPANVLFAIRQLLPS
jgi:proline dehydrogenase